MEAVKVIRESLGLSQTPRDYPEMCPPFHSDKICMQHVTIHIHPNASSEPSCQMARAGVIRQPGRRNSRGPEEVTCSFQVTQPERGCNRTRPRSFPALVLLPLSARQSLRATHVG